MNFHCGDKDKPRAAQQVLSAEFRYLGAASRDRLKVHYATCVDELRNIIERGCTNGDFDVPQTTVAAQEILAMLDVLVVLGVSSLDANDQS